jgi:hypothetical protein
MLSFEIKKSVEGKLPDELEVILDDEGLDTLLAQLRFLKERRTEHVHLMSESWGGTHLDDHASRVGNAAIHHVEILLRG